MIILRNTGYLVEYPSVWVCLNFLPLRLEFWIWGWGRIPLDEVVLLLLLLIFPLILLLPLLFLLLLPFVPQHPFPPSSSSSFPPPPSSWSILLIILFQGLHNIHMTSLARLNLLHRLSYLTLMKENDSLDVVSAICMLFSYLINPFPKLSMGLMMICSDFCKCNLAISWSTSKGWFQLHPTLTGW